MASADITPVMINDRLYRTVKEGQASILAPYQQESRESKNVSAQSGQPRNNDEGAQAVFYNPIQQYNRDLSVLAILIYGESAVELKQSKRKKHAGKGRQKKAPKPRSVETSMSRDKNANGRLEENTKKRKADDAGFGEDQGGDAEHTKRTCESNGPPQIDVEVQELRPPPGMEGGKSAISAETKESNTLDTACVKSPNQERKVSFTILDALSASGLRAIRYAKEIPFATTVVANDLLPEAVDAINLNIEHNNLADKVQSNVGDARQFMYSKTGNEALNPSPGYIHRFDVVDLDPYGTAAPFIDAAIQAVVDGGMLCVTCTDAGVWASNGYPEKTFALYDGAPLKGPHSHEAGLRLILHSIATAAARYGIAIEPLLSLSIDFYARLFVRVHKSQQEVKLMAGTTMLVYNCDQGCGAWQTQLLVRNQVGKARNGDDYFKHSLAQGPSAEKYCDHCGTKTHLGGPMWAGPLHNPAFVQKILDRLPHLDKTVYGTTDRIKGMLTVAMEEEDLDWPPPSSTLLKSAGSTSNGGRPEVTDNGSVEVTIDAGKVDKLKPPVSAIIPRLPPQTLSPAPLFFLPTYLAKILSIPTPAEDPLRGAFLGLGYSCTRSHCKPGSFKTNAPWKVVWEVMREWTRKQEAARIPRLLGEGEFEDKASVKKSSPGWKILKRLRGRIGDTLSVARHREKLLQKLGHASSAVDIESASDLRSVLQGVLYDLDHPLIANNDLDASAMTKEAIAKTTAGIETTQSDATHTSGLANGHETENVDVTRLKPPTSNDAVRNISGKALIDNGGDTSELEIVFDAELGRAFRESKGGKLVRYQINPRAHWGPMVRAGTGNS